MSPSYKPLKFINWFQIYGVRVDPPKEYTKGVFREFLNLGAVERPSEYLHLADTTSRGRMGLGAVQFHSFRTNSTQEVHARHNRSADGWFFDGHVEGMQRPRLEAIGIIALYGPDTIPSYVQ